jgi:hypothetical protein
VPAANALKGTQRSQSSVGWWSGFGVTALSGAADTEKPITSRGRGQQRRNPAADAEIENLLKIVQRELQTRV